MIAHLKPVYMPFVAIIVLLSGLSCVFETYVDLKSGQPVWGQSSHECGLVYKQTMCYSRQQLVDIGKGLSHTPIATQ